MKFKTKPNDLETVTSVVIQTMEIECQDDTKEEQKKEIQNESSILIDLFELLQQKIRTYGCFQIYFNKKENCRASNYFRQLENEAKRHLEHFLLLFNGNKISSLPEISFDFENDKETFIISAKLEEETAKVLQKAFEEFKNDFVKIQWLNEFKIFKTLSLAKKLKEENKNEFCDKSIDFYSGPCSSIC